MATPFARAPHIIDAELSTHRTLRADAVANLAAVRRRIAALEHDELGLVTAIDHRDRRIDRLLDERLACRTPERTT